MSAYLYNVVRRPKNGFDDLIGKNPDFQEAFSDTTVTPTARWLQFNYIDGNGEPRFWMAAALTQIKSWGTGAYMVLVAGNLRGEMTWTCVDVRRAQNFPDQFYETWDTLLEYATEHYL
jgi:hypothetical protein